MQARVMSFRVTPEQLEELDSAYQSSILPDLERQPGFLGLQVLFDAEKNRGLEIVLFESEDARRETERAGGILDRKVDLLTRVTGAPPDTENYELRLIS